jgi:hypothetical protein
MNPVRRGFSGRWQRTGGQGGRGTRYELKREELGHGGNGVAAVADPLKGGMVEWELGVVRPGGATRRKGGGARCGLAQHGGGGGESGWPAEAH